jgi:ParB family chromosome partitioning protein
LEEAEAFRSLQEGFGLSQEEVAQRVGKSRPAVANALRLLKLAPGVQELLRQGQLTAGQARPLLAMPPDEQEHIADLAVRTGLSARALESLSAGVRERPQRAARAPEPHAEAAAERLTRRLQTRVEIRRRRKGGVLRIHFHSEEELIRLYELLMGGEPR